MKFIVISKSLLKSLQQVSGVISSSSVLAILKDFLFQLDGSTLTISATDLETLMSVQIEVSEAEGKGAICIPGKILVDHLKGLPEMPVDFKIDTKDFTVEMVTSIGQYKITGASADDYPKAPVADDATSFNIPSQTLLNGLNKTLFAVSSDTLRPAMTGVFFQMIDYSLSFVAADAHRLAKVSCNNILSAQQVDGFIVPRKSLQQLKAALPEDETPLELSYNGSHLFVSIGRTNMICRLIDARFPDYKAVIPTDSPYKLTINRADFFSALRRVAVFANKTTNQTVLKIAGNTLQISAQDIDFSYEGKETMPCDYKGNDLVIAFNAKLIAEMIANMDGSEVVMELSTPTRAAIVKPVDMVDGEESLMLLMPLQVGV